ncbi:MAG: ABC transporter ATP-binding protein [Eubacteriales bacterium]|nr:ABC transporter ATP-binding protein [Eubacteriales bacterium]
MLLRIADLSKSYQAGKLALNHVSLDLDPGIYALLGVNGAGKSTLLNILSGIIARDTGEIFYQDQPIESVFKSYISELAYLPQYPNFYPDFRVDEILQYIGALKGVPRDDLLRRIDYLIDSLNLESYRSHSIKHLSGGTKQRVGIAQALLNDPKLIILDEPTSGLDPIERIRFRNLLVSHAPEAVILIATHIVSDAESMAERVILLHRGQVKCTGTPEGLCRELDGQVWLSHMEQVPKGERISQLKMEAGKLWVRSLGAKAPASAIESMAVPADLNDVFLYYSDQ